MVKEWLEDKGVLAAVSGDALEFIGASKAIYKVLASVSETYHENKDGNKGRIGSNRLCNTHGKDP